MELSPFATFMMVGCGGAVGAFLRAFLITVIEGRYKNPLFTGAFFVNCLSCCLAGCCLALAVGPVPHAIIAVGFCGGFSTLSAVNLDAANYLLEGTPQGRTRCYLYLLLTCVSALVTAGAGFAVTSALLGM